MSTIALFPDGRPSRVATLAGEASELVGMAHLLQAAHSEAAKRERPLTDTETWGWV